MLTSCDLGGNSISEDINKMFNKKPEISMKFGQFSLSVQKHDFRPNLCGSHERDFLHLLIYLVVYVYIRMFLIILHHIPQQILLYEMSWCTQADIWCHIFNILRLQLLQKPSVSRQSVPEPNTEPPPVICCGVRTQAQLLICCINRSAHSISQCTRAPGCEIILSAPH